MKNIRAKIAAGAVLVCALGAGSVVVSSAAGAAPADGRCVAQGAGFTFDGPTKASVAQSGLMGFVIRDHAFNGADATESLLSISICD